MTTGQPWVLLRGLTRESRHWGGFPAALETALGAQAHCLDLPGNGGLNHLRSPASVAAMADWCHGELRRRGIERPCRVLAMSLGAMVTVAWAQRHPGDLDRAVLVNTSLKPFNPVFQRLRPANYLLLLRLMALPHSAAGIERAILGMTARHPPEPSALLLEWTRLRVENPVSRQNALRQLLAAARYRAPMTPPLDKLLLLASARDGLVDPQCSRRLAAAWSAPLIEHPDAGHDLPLDDPRWVVEQVAAWVQADPVALPRAGNENAILP